MKNEPFVIERTYNAPAARVWKAITNVNDMKQWYFDLPEFKAEIGNEFSFKGGTKEKTYLHLCKVTEVVKEKKLTYSWRYDGYDGMSYVTFELFPEGEQTKLRLTHEGLETFATGNLDLARHNFEAGWTGFFDKKLKEFLEKSI